MVGRLSRARATLATATAHCCSSNRLRARKAHDRSKVYQPATSAAMRRHNAIAKCGGRARVPALHGERRFLESIGSRGRFRDRLTSHSGFAQKWLRLEKRFAQERPTGKSCPQMELCAPVEDPTHINLESLEEKGPPQWPKR